MKRRNAFTLVELLCCLTFLSLAVYPILACIRDSNNRYQIAKFRHLVMGKAQDAIEADRALAYTNALSAGTTTSSGTLSGSNISYTTTTTVTAVSGYTDLFLVTASCAWSNAALDNFGSTGSISVSTYMRNNHV